MAVVQKSKAALAKAQQREQSFTYWMVVCFTALSLVFLAIAYFTYT